MIQSARKQDVEGGRRPATPAELVAANINPRTGLATDYLNHFNEAVMLLELIPDMPDCTQDFLYWRPLSYADHFKVSNFKGRDIAIAAYEDSDAEIRAEFDALINAMTTILTEVSAAMRGARHESTQVDLARRATVWVKPMVAMAGGIINGTDAEEVIDAGEATDIDVIMARG